MLLRKLSIAMLILALCHSFNLHANETFNTEDLSLKNPKIVSDKVLSGGQPSLADLKLLKKMGVKRIINLRASDEFDDFNESVEAEKLGLEYFAIEVDGPEAISLENASRLDKLLADEGKTLVHCASGNRVGALFAIRAGAIQGLSSDEAIEFGKKSGLTRLEDRTKTVLEKLQEKASTDQDPAQ